MLEITPNDPNENRLLITNKKNIRRYFEKIGELSPVMMWAADRDKQCCYFNNNWLLFTAYQPENEKKDGWVVNIHPDDVYNCISSYNLSFDKKEKFNLEYRLKRFDGKYRWVLNNGAPFYINNEFMGYVCTVVDITDQKRLELDIYNSQQILSNILGNYPGIIFWKDSKSNYRGGNTEFLKAAGLNDQSELLGKSDFNLPWSQKEASYYIQADKEVIENKCPKTGIIESQLQADGSIAWYETIKVPLLNSGGEVVGILGISNDITEKVNIENNIKLQLKYSEAFNCILENILNEQDAAKILKTTTEIIGKTIDAERVNILKITSEDDLAIRMSEWINPMKKISHSDIKKYQISSFRYTNAEILNKKDIIISQRNNRNELLGKDSAADFIHNKLGIKSLLLNPFYFNGNNYFILALSHHNEIKKWTEGELNFIKRITDYVAVALQKINLVIENEERRKAHSESEHNLSILIEALPEIIIFKDIEGHWLTANQSALTSFKLVDKEYLGKTDSELADFVPEFRDFFYDQVLKDEQAFQLGKSLISEEVTLIKEGKELIYEIIRVPVYNSNDTYKGIVILGRNITEKRNNEIKLTVLSQAVKQSPASIVITDTNGNIEYVNDKFSQITGYAIDEVLGENPRILKAGGKLSEEYKDLWETITSGKEWSGEFLNKRKNGSLFWEAALISPIKNASNTITHYLAVKEDITEKKCLEINLKKALEKSEESDRMKTALIANMSHELRTPMNGILGMASILKEEICDQDKQFMIDSILLSSKRLMDTLNQVLELSNLQTDFGEDNIEEISLAAILNKIVMDYEFKAKQKNLCLKLQILDESLYVKSTYKNVLNLFSNLIDNAIKYTDSGSVEVIIKCESDKEKLKAVINIIDTGIGISHANHSKIFEEFRQVSEGMARNYEGTGLGLSIVKKILDLLGGNIYVESELGKGSDFTVILPAIRPAPLQNDLDITWETKNIIVEDFNIKQKKKLLLVEDNKINCIVTTKYLEDIYEIETSETGKAAIELARTNKYDLILMDINLGSGINGIEAIREIKNFKGYDKVPVIAITGYATDSARNKILDSSFDDLIIKPFEKGELCQVVKKYLEN